MRYPQPDHEDSFEEFCLALLRRHWNRPSLDRYAHRGQAQHGVDIIDTSGTLPLRAVQCKHHGAQQEISAQELFEEVEKAKGFPIKIQEYYFLTSAKKSGKAQIKLIEINQKHHQEGLFRVELLTWESIERLLDDYPDVRGKLEKFSSSVWIDHTTQVEGKLTAALAGNHTKLMEAVGKLSGESEIDLREIKEAIEQHEYQLGAILIRRLQNQKWDRLKPREKYWVLANLANLLLVEGKIREAAGKLFEAKTYQPDDFKAQAYEAFAYEILEKRGKACAIAQELLVKNPALSEAASIYARTAPDTKSISELEQEILPLTINAEVAVALSIRSRQHGCYDISQKYATKATQEDTDWPAAWLALGLSSLEEEFSKVSRNAAQGIRLINRSNIDKAALSLSKAIELAEKQKNSYVHAEALIARSRLHTLINQDGAAKSDIETAYQTLPTHPDVLIQHAHLLLEMGNAEVAIEDLRKAIASGAGSHGKMNLASHLNRSGKHAAQIEAQGIFSELATHRAAPYQVDAAIYGLRVLFQLQGQSEAGGYVENLRSFCAPTLFHVLAGILANLSGERERALSCTEAARSNVNSDTTIAEIRALADLLATLGLYQQSLQQWERVIVSGINGPDLRKMLSCAERIGRHDIILKALKDLREAGVVSQDFFQYEIMLLAQYDPDEAIILLTGYMREHPADKVAKLRLSFIAYRVGRLELIQLDKEVLPPLEEIRPEWLERLIQMMQAVAKNYNDVVELAYKLLQTHFSKPEAHMAFLMSMGLSSGQKPAIAEVSEVVIDCAVSYAENDDDNSSWVIIENTPHHENSSKYDIISPQDQFAQILIGRKIGDVIVLNPCGIQERAISIKAVVHKYIFVFNDILARWQIRFPDKHQIQQIREKNLSDSTSIEVPFASMLRLAKSNNEYVTELLDLYDKNPVPIHLLAKKLGFDDISTAWSLAIDRKRQIRCAEPGREEESVSMLQAGSSLVIDTTALATALHLELEDILPSMPNSVMCSYGLRDDLNRLVEYHVRSNHKGNFGYSNDQFVLTEVSDEAQVIKAQTIIKKAEAVKSACKLINARALASLEQKAREHLTELFGNATSEAIANASIPGVLLWTDDYVIGHEAQRMLGVKSISTPVLLAHWYRGGAISYEKYCQACARLLAWNYAPTPVDVDILVEAGKLANWNTEAFPLDGALDWFERDSIPRDGVAIVAGRFIPAIYFEIALPLNREIFLSKLLGRIAKRIDGLIIIQIIRRYLPGNFGLNIIGLTDALAAISTWLASRRR